MSQFVEFTIVMSPRLPPPEKGRFSGDLDMGWTINSSVSDKGALAFEMRSCAFCLFAARGHLCHLGVQ